MNQINFGIEKVKNEEKSQGYCLNYVHGSNDNKIIEIHFHNWFTRYEIVLKTLL